MNLENKDVDGILQYADPVIAAILNKAISGKDITSREALVLFDEGLKTSLKTEKLTTRDSRSVERKKPGRRKARRSFQFSKR